MAIDLDHSKDILKTYWLDDEPTMRVTPAHAPPDEKRLQVWMDKTHGGGCYNNGILLFKAEGASEADLATQIPMQQDPRPAAEAPELQVYYRHVTRRKGEQQHFRPVRIDVKSMIILKIAGDETDVFFDVLRNVLSLEKMTQDEIKRLFKHKR